MQTKAHVASRVNLSDGNPPMSTQLANFDNVKSRQHAWRAIVAMDRESHGYIRRHISDAAEAEDVMHDFYVRVLEHAHTLRDRGSARSWLYRVLRSALMEHLRAKRRSGDVVTRLGSQVVEVTLDATSVDDVFEEILTQLKPEYADILVRLQIQADTPWEAAADLGITPNNVCVRHFRARAALRDAYLRSEHDDNGRKHRVVA